MGRDNPTHQYRLGAGQPESSSVKKDLGILLDKFSEPHSDGMRCRGHKFQEGRCYLGIRRIKSTVAVDRLKNGLRDDV